MAEYGPLAKIGPPLRPEDGPDRDSLWRGLGQGSISIVASDHAPYPQELKQPGWDNIFVDSNGASVPFGSPGVETIVPLMYSEGGGKARPAHLVAGPRHVGKPGPHFRAVPP